MGAALSKTSCSDVTGPSILTQDGIRIGTPEATRTRNDPPLTVFDELTFAHHFGDTVMKTLSHCLAPVGAMGIGSLFAGPAHAQSFTMSMGQGMAIGGLDGLPFATVDSRLGMSTGRVFAYANLDMWKAAVKVDGDNVGVGIHTAGVGARYSLRDREVKNAVPYVAGGAYTIMVIGDTGEDELDDIVGDVQSLGVTAGFGSEYLVSRAFSVSGEFGVQHYLGKYEEDGADLGASFTNTYANIWLSFYM